MYSAFNNWKVVILSLLGATTFWFFNALNKTYDARINYPIECAFETDSVVVMKPLPQEVIVDVTSGGWNLLRKTFWFNVTPVRVELENPTEIGFYTRSSLLPIIEEQLNDIDINFMLTDTVYIDIEEKKTKRVRLAVDSLHVDLAGNHRITSPISVVPDSITLIGPASFIDSLGQTYSMPLEIEDINKSIDREMDVLLPSSKIESRPQEVSIQFNVQRFERMTLEVPITPRNFPSDSSVYLHTDRTQIFYTVPSVSRREFRPREFEITADLEMMDRADSTVMAILLYYPEEAIDIELILENLKVMYAE